MEGGNGANTHAVCDFCQLVLRADLPTLTLGASCAVRLESLLLLLE